jgi:geranylgeranyl pyrophosphate synthase
MVFVFLFSCASLSSSPRQSPIRSLTQAPGDVEEAHARVLQSDGLSLTRKLAYAHAGVAMERLSRLAPSPERDALFKLCDIVCTRTK